MNTRRTVRLALVSVAPTPATRAARFAHDEGLDADGLRRATAAARALAAGGPGSLPGRARVLIDGSARARQTARALGLAARAGEAGIQVDDALRDLDVGAWRGRELADIPLAELRDWHEQPAMTPPGGESRADLLDRVATWLAGLAAGPTHLSTDPAHLAAPEHVIAVTHPAVIRAALLTVLRCPPDVFWRVDVAPLTATLFHRPAPTAIAAATPTDAHPQPTAWTLTHACRPL